MDFSGIYDEVIGYVVAFVAIIIIFLIALGFGVGSYNKAHTICKEAAAKQVKLDSCNGVKE